ncbi:MAG: energy transducer TonB [Bacteroidales bacterium]|nr:energy transducer TonB [Bacteroidales bacterium]
MKRFVFLTTALALSLLAAAQTPQETTAPRQQAATETDNAIFTVVEQAPEYPGGMEALYQFIASNIKYPGSPETSVNGKVVVSFVIEKDGSISNAKVVRELAPGFGDEALRVVKLMPKWKPGRQNGEPVRVQFNLPVNFSQK